LIWINDKSGVMKSSCAMIKIRSFAITINMIGNRLQLFHENLNIIEEVGKLESISMYAASSDA